MKMASTLSNDEEQATKIFIEELNRQDSNNGPVAWSTAVKFLCARKFDVRRALDLYVSHQLIREKEGLQVIDPKVDCVRRELLSDKFTILHGRDAQGAALALFTARLHYPARTTHQSTLKAVVFQLDTALSSLETQRNGLVFIYDMTQSKYSNFDYELSIKILSMLKGSYPARLKKVLIVTAPLWFRAPFKILRLFVKEKLRDRVHTVSQGQLPLHVPAGSIPERLGGTMQLQHKEWIRTCMQMCWGKSSEVASDISIYLEHLDNNIMTELSVSSISSLGSATSPTGDESMISTSDLESEGSRGTVHEKQQSEYQEKEVGHLDNTMDTSEDGSPHIPSSPTSPAPHIVSSNPPSAVASCKRDFERDDVQNVVDGSDVPALPRKKRPAPTTDDDWDHSIHCPEPGGYNIKEFVEITRIKGRKGLYREYARVKSEPPVGTFETSKAKSNLPKNRYTDVLCLDHSRVQLSTDGEDTSDYINANFVDGYKQKGAYISTQGPLPRTFADYWRMVWEQMVLLVVMTTRTVERSRLKCGQYWPMEEDGVEEYGDFIVINNGMDHRENYTLTSLILQNTKTDETREITHFQFTSWPDYGVPHSAEAFLDFMFHVRKRQQERTQELSSNWDGHPGGPPIVIHCSAGIGRTGTFITMDISTRRLDDIGTVDILKAVRRIRTQRAFSIQMPDQYVFCHLALIEHAQREEILKEVDLDGFEDSSSDSD